MVCAQAEESGRRQIEQLQRDEEGRQWREAMRIYKASADTFISQVVNEAVDTVAARQAAYEVKFKAERLDSAVLRVHEQHDEAKMVVFDIVSSYLFPEVRLLTPFAFASRARGRFGRAPLPCGHCMAFDVCIRPFCPRPRIPPRAPRRWSASTSNARQLQKRAGLPMQPTRQLRLLCSARRHTSTRMVISLRL